MIYDQLLFRPLVSWADRFRIDSEQGEEAPEAWVLTAFRRSRLMERLAAPFAAPAALELPAGPAQDPAGRGPRPPAKALARLGDIAWYGDHRAADGAGAVAGGRLHRRDAELGRCLAGHRCSGF